MAVAPQLPAIIPDVIASPVETVLSPAAMVVAPLENAASAVVNPILGTGPTSLVTRQALVGAAAGGGIALLASQLLGHKEVKGSRYDPGFLTRIEEAVGATAQVALGTVAGAGVGAGAALLQLPGAGAWGLVGGVTAVALPYLMP